MKSATLLPDTAVAAHHLLAVGDPGRTRTVVVAIVLLVAIGIGLVALAVWLVRSTRVDPEVLAPLEVMGERGWREADHARKRRRLDEVRPDDAEPLDPMAPVALTGTASDPDPGPGSGEFDDFDDLLRQFGIQLDDAAPDTVAEPLARQDPVVSDPVTVSEPDTSAGSEPEPEPEPEPESEPVPVTEPESESVPVTEYESEAVPVTESESEPAPTGSDTDDERSVDATSDRT